MKKKRIDPSKRERTKQEQMRLRTYLSSDEAHCTLQAIMRESDDLVDRIERGRRLDSVLFRASYPIS